MGGEGDGSVSAHANMNANATSAGVHPPATTPVNVVAANGGSGNANTGKGGGGGLVASNNTRSPATPARIGGFQSFAAVLLSWLQTLPNKNIRCPHGATANNALLVQFLASQCPAFSTPSAALPTPAPCMVAGNGDSGNDNTGKGGGGGLVESTNTRSPATPAPTGGCQTFPRVLLSWLQTLPSQNIRCPHGATANTALLVQFLASQYPTFSTPGAALPTPMSFGDHNAPKVTDPVGNPVSNTSPACNLQTQKETRPDPGVQANHLGSPNHPDGANNATNHGNSKEKSPSWSYSSAIVRNSQSGDGEAEDNELLNGDSDLVFTVKRRSKMRGARTRHLKMSDVRKCFHLTVDNAAKKLGVSPSTLKNACRIFGVDRWPGRKVRSLQSTIYGLKQEIAAGQGNCLEDLEEAHMLSEVCKLQQEMHQLVHGTPAQVTQKMHSPAVKTADIYKRLYYRGWRSKYHSAGRHDMFTLDTGNPSK